MYEYHLIDIYERVIFLKEKIFRIGIASALLLIVVSVFTYVSFANNSLSTELIAWGFRRGENNQQPTLDAKAVKIVEQFDGYTMGNKDKKCVYLTFDAGYEAGYTENILKTLKENNVEATFFITGYNNNYNDLITREHNEGHTVGLHSYSHNYSSIYRSVDAFMQDLLNIENKIYQYTGQYSKITRFPGGSSNTVSRKYKIGIMSELTKKLEELGYRYFDWTITSGDAGGTTSSSKIIENVTKSITENGANVVLMHDIKSYTVNAIENIIQYGLANGYKFAPLTMESPVVHQRVNN